MKVKHFFWLATSEMNKPLLYILSIMFVGSTVMHLHFINRADKYYMPIVPLKGILVKSCLPFDVTFNM